MFSLISNKLRVVRPCLTICIRCSCWKISLFFFCKNILMYILLIFCKAQLVFKFRLTARAEVLSTQLSLTLKEHKRLSALHFP